jgi:hypothetical protein
LLAIDRDRDAHAGKAARHLVGLFAGFVER